MQSPDADSVLDYFVPSGVDGREDAVPAALEQEVTILFDDLRRPLLRYLLALGLSPHDAEEVVQEAFLSLFRHLMNRKPRTNLRGWLFRVVHNLGLKRRQANSRMQAAANGNETPADLQIDPRPDPEQQFADHQRRQRLLAVVGVLPELDRYSLYLRAEGLRYREIAQVLGISLGGVALSLSRSLKRLSRVDAQ